MSLAGPRTTARSVAQSLGYESLKDFAESVGVPTATLRRRLAAGLPMDEVVKKGRPRKYRPRTTHTFAWLEKFSGYSREELAPWLAGEGSGWRKMTPAEIRSSISAMDPDVFEAAEERAERKRELEAKLRAARQELCEAKARWKQERAYLETRLRAARAELEARVRADRQELRARKEAAPRPEHPTPGRPRRGHATVEDRAAALNYSRQGVWKAARREGVSVDEWLSRKESAGGKRA